MFVPRYGQAARFSSVFSLRFFPLFAGLLCVLATATLAQGPVTVSPAKVSLDGHQQQSFTATGRNNTSTAVSWTTTCGTLSSSTANPVTYTAPLAAGPCTLKATSKADTTKSATAIVTVLPVTVAVSPLTASLSTHQQQTFTATVGNSLNKAVKWSATCGTFSNSTVNPATYTAPTTGGACTVTALSTAGTNISATATVTVTPVTVSIAPAPVTVATHQQQSFTATVGGSSNTAVTWSATCGTLSSRTANPTTYTAPATGGTCTVTATAAADSTKKATATVTVKAADTKPVIASFVATPSTISSGASSTLTWSVSGATNLVLSGLGTVTGSSVTVSPTVTTSYTLTATNGANTSLATVQVTVAAPTGPEIALFEATPAAVAPGGTATLNWSVTGAKTLTLSSVGDVTGKSSASVKPGLTTTYLLTAVDVNGNSTSAAATVAVTGAPQAGQWVVGYYAGYQSSLQTPSQVDYTALTHVAVFSILPNPDGSWNTAFFIDNTNGPAWAQQVVANAHAAGAKALVTLGGSSTDSQFEAVQGAMRATNIANLKTIVDTYGFDGVDLDWEGYDIASEGPTVVAYLQAIKTAMPDKIVTVAAGWASPNFPFDATYNAHYNALGGLADRVSCMCYGMIWVGGGWESWHMTALDGAKPATPSSLEYTVAALAAAGIPMNKIGIGIGFYGYAFQGPDANLPSGPNQNTDNDNIDVSDNTLSYSNLLQYVITPDAVRWDDQPQSTYLSWPQPHNAAVGGTNLRTRFITYEDERSIAAKGNWARAQGLGGVIVWTISEGYLGWRTSGEKDPLMKTIKAAFLSPQGAPQILSFSAGAQSIVQGQSVVLNWSVANSTSLSIDQGVGTVTGNSVTVSPAQTTTYTLSATNGAGATIFATSTVVVTPSPSVASFSAAPATITAGQFTTLSWSLGGSSAQVDLSPGLGPVAGSQAVVSPVTTTTYTLTASSVGGSAQKQVTVTVQPAVLPSIDSFTASPAAVLLGGSATLLWSVSGGATGLRIDPGAANGNGGLLQVTPSATTTYTLTASNAAGSVTKTVVVTVSPSAPLIQAFTASPGSLIQGASATLSWSVIGAASLSIDQGVGSVTGSSGTFNVVPSATTTYTLTASNANGKTTATATVQTQPSLNYYTLYKNNWMDQWQADEWSNENNNMVINSAAPIPAGYPGTDTTAIEVNNGNSSWGAFTPDLPWNSTTAYPAYNEMRTLEFDIWIPQGATGSPNVLIGLNDDGLTQWLPLSSLIQGWSGMADAQRYQTWHHAAANLAQFQPVGATMSRLVLFNNGNPNIHYFMAHLRLGWLQRQTPPVLHVGTPDAGYDLTSVTLPFSTDEATTWVLHYGPNSYASVLTGPSQPGFGATPTLSGQAPGETLLYRITASDSRYQASPLTGVIEGAVTIPLVPSIPPVISSMTISAVGSSGNATLSWTTSRPCTAQVVFLGQVLALNSFTTQGSFVLTGLTAGKQTSVVLRVTDDFGMSASHRTSTQ